MFGGLTDAFGTAINFTSIKELAIFNRGTTSGEFVTIGGNFVATFLGGTSQLVVLYSGGSFHVSKPLSGMPVTQGVLDTLTITEFSVSGITYDIFLIGTV